MRFFVQTFHNRIFFHFCNVNHFPWRHSFLELLYCKELVDISFCYKVFQGFLLKFPSLVSLGKHVTLDGLELQKSGRISMRSSVYYTIEAFPLCFISILGFGVGAALIKKAPMHFLNPVLPRSDVGKPYKINMDCWLRFKQSRDSNLQNQWACEPVFQSGF